VKEQIASGGIDKRIYWSSLRIRRPGWYMVSKGMGRRQETELVLSWLGRGYKKSGIRKGGNSNHGMQEQSFIQ
jgi:hypothetical protein